MLNVPTPPHTRYWPSLSLKSSTRSTSITVYNLPWITIGLQNSSQHRRKFTRIVYGVRGSNATYPRGIWPLLVRVLGVVLARCPPDGKTPIMEDASWWPFWVAASHCNNSPRPFGRHADNIMILTQVRGRLRERTHFANNWNNNNNNCFTVVTRTCGRPQTGTPPPQWTGRVGPESSEIFDNNFFFS